MKMCSQIFQNCFLCLWFGLVMVRLCRPITLLFLGAIFMLHVAVHFQVRPH